MKEKFNIVFFGTPEFAIPSLKSLINDGFKVIACVTNPDRPKGRNLKISPSPIKKLAQKYNLPVLQPERINDQGFFNDLKELKPDVFVVVAYGKILPKEIIYLPTFDSLNVHASLLPKYRGASPIHYALLNGDKETGVTIMKMDEYMDTGPILAQEKTTISKNETLKTLHDKLAKNGAKLLSKTLEAYFHYSLKPQKQDHSQASYTKILKKEDGKIDWQNKAEEIERKIRAFNLWPGTFTGWQNKNLKIIEVAVPDTKIKEIKKPGKVLVKNKKIFVATKDLFLEIKKLQLAGGKALSNEEFLSGFPNLDSSQFN